MKTREKILFKAAENIIERLRSHLLQLIAISIIVIAAINFNENPVVISILILLLTAFVLIAGHSEIIVYENSIEFVYVHLFFKSKRWNFPFKDIDFIETDLRLSKKNYLLSEIGSRLQPGFSVWNVLRFNLKDGSNKVINTQIYKHHIDTAIEIVKTRIKDLEVIDKNLQ